MLVHLLKWYAVGEFYQKNCKVCMINGKETVLSYRASAGIQYVPIFINVLKSKIIVIK